MLEQEILIKKKQLHTTSEDLTLMVGSAGKVRYALQGSLHESMRVGAYSTRSRDNETRSETLHIFPSQVNCYRETQVAAWKSQGQLLEHTKISTVRRSEVSFKHALWKLTDETGNLALRKSS